MLTVRRFTLDLQTHSGPEAFWEPAACCSQEPGCGCQAQGSCARERAARGSRQAEELAHGPQTPQDLGSSGLHGSQSPQCL